MDKVEFLLPLDVVNIINTINKNGFEAYVVGGCVRDFIMNIPPHDFDITTSALPTDIKKMFSHTVDTGIEHGTVTVVLNKCNYEVTTYRIDGEYADFRRPDEVFFTNNLKEDLVRRDFTINALAYHPKEGIVDYFDGVEHIKNKMIIGVGDPNLRFNEDALRMLRAIRFSCKLGFLIDETTKEALLKNRELIKHVSVERVREELLKAITSEYVHNLKLFWESELALYIDKTLYKTFLDNGENIILELEMSPKDDVTACYLIIFQYLNKDELKSVLKYFKFDNKTAKALTLVKPYLDSLNENSTYDKILIKKILNDIDITNTMLLFNFLHNKYKNMEEALVILKKILDDKEPFLIKHLNIDGEKIMKLGVLKGKNVGEALSYLINAVIVDENLNNYDNLALLIKESGFINN